MSQRMLPFNNNTNTKTTGKITKGGSTDISSHSNRRPLGSSSLRQSTGNLSAHNAVMGVASNGTQNSTDIRRIEAEYIKNLQQQVYFLELEANFLREQAKKSSELQPQMTAEAKRMIGKLQELNSELNTARSELKVLESSAEVYQKDKDVIARKLKATEETHQKEKKILMDEIVQLKKENEALDRGNVNKDARLADIEQQLDHSNSAARAAESKARSLEAQLSEKNEQLRLLQQSLEEKRVECLKTEEKLRQTEEKYYSSIVRVNDRAKDDFKQDEIRLLKQRLKEYESHSSHDRYMRNKSTDDSASLAKENASLTQQLIELKSQLEKKSARNGLTAGLREDEGELLERPHSSASLHSGVEMQVRRDLEKTRDQLQREQEKVKHYVEQLARLEDQNKSQQLSESTLRSKIAELTALHNNADSDTEKLRQDKDNLIQHMDQLQKQLDEKQTTLTGLRNRIHFLETRVKELEHLRDLQSNIQSQKWEEFSRLAENMKTLSKSMAKPGANPAQWTNKSDLLDL